MYKQTYFMWFVRNHSAKFTTAVILCNRLHKIHWYGISYDCI